MLRRLLQTERLFPADATEIRLSEDGKNVTVYRLTDLTRAFREITEGLPKPGEDDMLAEARRMLEGIPSAF